MNKQQDPGKNGIEMKEILEYLVSHNDNDFANDIRDFTMDCAQLAHNMITLYDEKAPAMLIGDV